MYNTTFYNEFGVYGNDPIQDEFLGKAFKKVGSGIKNAAKKVGNLVRENTNPFVLAMPLVPVMLMELKRRGVKVKGSSVKEVVITFYNEVVKKADDFFYDYQVDDFEPVTAMAIVNQVISFVKKMLKKRKDKALTENNPEAIRRAEGAERVLENIKNVSNQTIQQLKAGKDAIERDAKRAVDSGVFEEDEVTRDVRGGVPSSDPNSKNTKGLSIDLGLNTGNGFQLNDRTLMIIGGVLVLGGVAYFVAKSN